MYCVIQEIENKKPVTSGANKSITVDKMVIGFNGDKKVKYSYSYSDDKFERPIKKAYKISIHQSYRENGKVKKQQWVLCTIGYYELIEFGVCDCIATWKLEEKLQQMGINETELWDIVYKKLDPLVEKIKNEFSQTDEYKAIEEQKKIINKHIASKREFENKYGKDTYDYCYDVFGELRNPEHLEQVKVKYKEYQEYKERSYQNYKQSNYNYDNNSSYYIQNQSNYNEEEKKMLKKIFRTLSMKYHPDKNNNDDSGEMMKFVNKLKEQWGI